MTPISLAVLIAVLVLLMTSGIWLAGKLTMPPDKDPTDDDDAEQPA